MMKTRVDHQPVNVVSGVIAQLSTISRTHSIFLAGVGIELVELVRGIYDTVLK